MIPITDSVKTRSFPYVNITIIITCILVFMYEVYISGDPAPGYGNALDRLFYEWGNVPKCTFDALGIGAEPTLSEQARICGRQDYPALTIFSAMFLHGGWLHLAGNMLFLWIFGDNVEDSVGHVRYAIFYLLCGTLASLAHGAVDANSIVPAIGASGAIAGIMGAYLVLFPRAKVVVIFGFILIPIPLPAFVLIGFWFVSQLFVGFASLGPETTSGGGIAYFAHIGGFVAGAVLINVFVLGRRAYIRRQHRREDFW